MSEPLRVAVLYEDSRKSPLSDTEVREKAMGSHRAEHDVVLALAKLGHPARPIPSTQDIRTLIETILREPVDVVFNICEGFLGQSHLEGNVAALLELLGLRYTGSPPAALFLARDKGQSKRILNTLGVKTPAFATFDKPAAGKLPDDLRFPLIVKPVAEDASVGIAQRSVVRDEKTLAERVAFIHASHKQPAIVEEFIDGRELYAGVLGNEDAKVLPLMELRFDNLQAGAPPVATFRAKWSPEYRARHGIRTVFPDDLPKEVVRDVKAAALATYHGLGLRDYGRIDLRVKADGSVYVLEANPNPFIMWGEDLPSAAEKAGISYPKFLDGIVRDAFERQPVLPPPAK